MATTKKANAPATLSVKQVRSGIGRAETMRRTLRSLGLRHHQHTVTVLEVTCAEPDTFATEVRDALQVEASVVGGALRLHSADVHRLVPPLMERFGDRVQRLTLSRPSLEDVFIHKTGHRFWMDDAQAETGGG